jgi:hypothetical protein
MNDIAILLIFLAGCLVGFLVAWDIFSEAN